ncbi:MAG: hypothetical protein KIT84_39060 [Labilithrix sp.]|nr:hypothetical protein [Labilithrix sp.]MCW5817062.1 hypothetical protein [Labilithrix sp.]
MTSVPTERQLALFSALEDTHDLTAAIVVLLADEDGTTIAVSGDEAEIPPDLRAVLAGKKLAAAGSVRALLEPVDFTGMPLNVSIFSAGAMVLAIFFDADADLSTVQTVGKQAAEMIGEILVATAAN